jgi:hypothetical protein
MQTNIDETQFPLDNPEQCVKAKGIAVPLKNDKCVALGMGLLSRLGPESPVKLLDTYLLEQIATFAPEHCSVPDLPLPKIFDGVIYNFIKQHGYGLDYTIHHDAEAVLIEVELPDDGYIYIVDSGPRSVESDTDTAEADAASNEKLYGDGQFALSSFNPGNVTLQFRHESFQQCMHGNGELEDYGHFFTGLNLQDPNSGETFNNFNHYIEDGHYESVEIYIPESTEHLERLLNALLHIAAPVIEERWKTLSVEKRARFLACRYLDD